MRLLRAITRFFWHDTEPRKYISIEDEMLSVDVSIPVIPRASRADIKVRKVRQWAYAILSGAGLGTFPIEVESGPRIARIRFYPGERMTVLQSFVKSPNANHLCPWRLAASPHVEVEGQALVVEAAWASSLADTKYTLNTPDVEGQAPGVFRIGVDMAGNTVMGALDDVTPHFLIAGMTGSGKSVLMRSIAFQLALNDVRLVLIDGKYGATFGRCAGLPGAVGPVACEQHDAAMALGWTLSEMESRYTAMRNGQSPTLLPRIAVLADEFIDFDKAGVKDALDRIARQGREARIHLLLSTQHPTKENLESDARRNLPGRVALKVENEDANRLIVAGASVRADKLLGSGDAFYITPSVTQRVQCYMIPDDVIKHEAGLETDYPAWANVRGIAVDDVESLFGAAVTTEARYRALALEVAQAGDGRPILRKRIDEAGLPGLATEKLAALMRDAKKEVKATRT